jgi:hypothetical protein
MPIDVFGPSADSDKILWWSVIKFGKDFFGGQTFVEHV